MITIIDQIIKEKRSIFKTTFTFLFIFLYFVNNLFSGTITVDTTNTPEREFAPGTKNISVMALKITDSDSHSITNIKIKNLGNMSNLTDVTNLKLWYDINNNKVWDAQDIYITNSVWNGVNNSWDFNGLDFIDNSSYIDLSGWDIVIKGSLNYTIPAGTILTNGGYLIISRNCNQTTFNNHYSTAAPAGSLFINSSNSFNDMNGTNDNFLIRDNSDTVQDPTTVNFSRPPVNYLLVDDFNDDDQYNLAHVNDLGQFTTNCLSDTSSYVMFDALFFDWTFGPGACWYTFLDEMGPGIDISGYSNLSITIWGGDSIEIGMSDASFNSWSVWINQLVGSNTNISLTNFSGAGIDLEHVVDISIGSIAPTGSVAIEQISFNTDPLGYSMQRNDPEANPGLLPSWVSGTSPWSNAEPRDGVYSGIVISEVHFNPIKIGNSLDYIEIYCDVPPSKPNGILSGTNLIITMDSSSGAVPGKYFKAYIEADNITCSTQSTGPSSPITNQTEQTVIPDAPLDHFEVIHDGIGVRKNYEQIIIHAITANSIIKTNFTGVVTLDLAGGSIGTIDWETNIFGNNGTLVDLGGGEATYNFVSADNGVVTLRIKDDTAESVDIEVVSSITGKTDNDISPQRLRFYEHIFYVNDGNTIDDIYTTSTGNNTFHGLSPDKPKKNISNILNTYDLEPGAMVYVDSGNYSGFSISAGDSGNSNAYVTFLGAGLDKTIITNYLISPDSGADHLKIKGFQTPGIQGGGIGHVIESNKIGPSSSHGIYLSGSGHLVRGNTICSNGLCGIYINGNMNGSVFILDNHIYFNATNFNTRTNTIEIVDAPGSVIKNNLVENIPPFCGHGIILHSTALGNIDNSKILNNIIKNSEGLSEINISGDGTANNILIQGNIIFNNSWGRTLQIENNNNNSGIISKNLIYNNVPHGIYFLNANDNRWVVQYNTIYGNNGIGIKADKVDITVKNCITAGNSIGGIYVESGYTINVSNSCINDGVSGTGSVVLGNGCISNSPLFVDVATKNFHLSWNSPCQNTATSNIVAACMGYYTGSVVVSDELTNAAVTHRITFNVKYLKQVPSNGIIDITYPLGFKLEGVNNVNSTSKWGGTRGAFTPAIIGNRVRIIRSGGTTSTAGEAENLILSFVTNASAAGTNYDVYITLRSNNGAVIDEFLSNKFRLTNIFIPPPPPSAPDVLAVTAASPFELDIIWENVLNETTYTLFINTSNYSGTAIAVTNTAGGITNFKDTGLTPDTWYYFWARAYNSSGASAFGAVFSNKTPASFPGTNETNPFAGGKVEIGPTTIFNNEKLYFANVTRDTKISIYDVKGRLLWSADVTDSSQCIPQVEYLYIKPEVIEDLVDGLYIIVFKNNKDKSQVRKFNRISRKRK